MTKTAKLYGGSLYDLAAEESLTEPVMEEMDSIRQIFRENPDYLVLLSEPSIPKTERVALLNKAFDGQIQPYLLNFLGILCENGALREFGGCCDEFRSRYNADHNIAEAVVSSAVALSESQAEALKKRLEDMSKKTIVLTQKVDEGLLGGLRVELEGKQLDGTTHARLISLRKKITEIIV